MKLLPLATTILLALSAAVTGHEFKLADVEITHPYLAATLPGAKTAAAYMILTNTGSEPDRLLAIETDAAVRVEFHQSVVTDGVSRMRPIAGGLEIPAGGEYRLGADGSQPCWLGSRRRSASANSSKQHCISRRPVPSTSPSKSNRSERP
jgi:copper(I)-binding protein